MMSNIFLFIFGLQKLQDEVEKTGSKMKQHEDNLKFLKAQKNQLDDAILDLQGIILILHYFRELLYLFEYGSRRFSGSMLLLLVTTYDLVTYL